MPEITFPDKPTYGDLYGPAMRIKSRKKADEYLAALIARGMRDDPKLTRQEAESIEKHNLGYYAGYHDAETRKRVHSLFSAPHPVFDGLACYESA